jgi:hypothetical protein
MIWGCFLKALQLPSCLGQSEQGFVFTKTSIMSLKEIVSGGSWGTRETHCSNHAVVWTAGRTQGFFIMSSQGWVFPIHTLSSAAECLYLDTCEHVRWHQDCDAWTWFSQPFIHSYIFLSSYYILGTEQNKAPTSMYLYACLASYLSIYLSIYIPTYLSTCLSIYIAIYLHT